MPTPGLADAVGDHPLNLGVGDADQRADVNHPDVARVDQTANRERRYVPGNRSVSDAAQRRVAVFDHYYLFRRPILCTGRRAA